MKSPRSRALEQTLGDDDWVGPVAEIPVEYIITQHPITPQNLGDRGPKAAKLAVPQIFDAINL